MLKFSILEQIALAIFLLSGISFFLYHLLLRLKIILKGKSNFSVDELPKRLKRVFDEVILHKKSSECRKKVCWYFTCFRNVWFYLLWFNYN